ncbi:hypothetical protein M1N59_01400, partial [Dehalococcoidales bacterium]|nr:hypothetical protein [Dehalococcoidales bacterium]
ENYNFPRDEGEGILNKILSNFSNFPASHKAIKAKLWRFKEGKNKETNGNFLYDQVIPKEIG